MQQQKNGWSMQDASKSMQQWRCEKESLENLSTLLQLSSQLVLHESNKASVLSTDQETMMMLQKVKLDWEGPFFRTVIFYQESLARKSSQNVWQNHPINFSGWVNFAKKNAGYVLVNGPRGILSPEIMVPFENAQYSKRDSAWQRWFSQSNVLIIWKQLSRTCKNC